MTDRATSERRWHDASGAGVLPRRRLIPSPRADVRRPFRTPERGAREHSPGPDAPRAARDARPDRRGPFARQLLPRPWPSRRAPRSARHAAHRRPGARPGLPRAQRRDPGADPFVGAEPPHAGRDAARGAPGPAADVRRLDRVPDRAHRRPRRAALAARGHRVAPLRRADDARAASPPVHPAVPRRGFRAVPAPRLPGREAVLDRGHGHHDPDARRGDRDRGRPGHPGGRDRHGPPRAAERARACPAPPLLLDPGRVRGPAVRGRGRRPAGRRARRRQVPPRRARRRGASRSS